MYANLRDRGAVVFTTTKQEMKVCVCVGGGGRGRGPRVSVGVQAEAESKWPARSFTPRAGMSLPGCMGLALHP